MRLYKTLRTAETGDRPRGGVLFLGGLLDRDGAAEQKQLFMICFRHRGTQEPP